MDSNSLECINPAKSLEQAISECSKRNTVVVYSEAPFKKTFEAELFKDTSHYPLLILVDRPSEITDYYKQFTTSPDDNIAMLDGLMNLDQVKEDWQEIVRRKKCKVLITSCSTALFVFVHGFVRLGEHFRTLYIPNMPAASHSGHSFLKLVKLLYDPVIMHNVRIVGLGTTKPRTALPESEIVFALNEWNLRVRFYALELHCQVVNVIPTLPLPQLQLFPTSNFSWSLIHADTLLGTVKDVRKRMLLVVEDEGVREALLDSLQRRQVTGDLQGVKVFSSDSPFFSNYAQEKACVLLCSFMHMHYLADVSIEEAMVVISTSNHLSELSRVLARCAIPCQLCATFDDNQNAAGSGGQLLGQLKAYLSLSETEKEEKIMLKSGGVVHACVASDLLLRFCSYLPKTSVTGRALKGVQIMTVPVRRLDADGEIIATDLNDLFATQIVLPERLLTWFPEPIVGRAMSSRADAQASAAFEVFKKLVSLGLVDSNLLAIPGIRMQEAQNTNYEEEDEEDEEEEAIVMSGNSNASDSLTMDEVIPEQLIYRQQATMHLYALEYHLEGPEVNQLPAWSRKLLAGGGDFFTTKAAAWGVLVPGVLPEGLLPVRVALGAEHYLLVTLRSCGQVETGGKEFETILGLQALFFSLLNTRPLSVAEELSNNNNSSNSNGYDLNSSSTYFLVPLINPEAPIVKVEDAYLNHQEVEYSNSLEKGEEVKWKLDKTLMEALRREEDYGNCWEYIQTLGSDNEGLLNFALSQLLLFAPYNRMYYRFRKMYMDHHPDSSLQVKGTSGVTTYLDYVREKYNEATDASIDLEQPLIGVARVENFADVSQWVLPNAEDEENSSGPMLKKRKREDAQTKSALIPSLVKVLPLKYWRVRMLMAVPKVMSEVERQLQAIQFYNFLNLSVKPPPPDLAVCSLAAVTAGLDYNYERLEVLGDSLLKMAVSLELMSSEEVLGEGRLSQRRQSKISNVNLFRIGASLGIWKHAALTTFSAKLWTPPGIYSLLSPSNDDSSNSGTVLREKLLKVMFDPSLRWKLLKQAETRVNTREDPWTLTHEGTLLPPSGTSANTKHVSLSRWGMAIPNKFVADMVEASVGAYFLGCGMESAWRYLIHLGILTPHILKGAQVPKLKQMGKLLGDPRDKLPLFSSPHNSVNRGKNVSKKHKKALMKKVDWSKLPSKQQDQVEQADVEQADEQVVPQVCIKTTDLEKEYEAFVAQNTIDFDKIEGILGYKFKERRLLLSAFTHITHSVYFCGERLEWLGDALLDWIVTVYFYQQGADTRAMNPFELTEARKSSVNNVSLSEVCVYYRFHEHLLLGAQTGKLREEMDLFSKAVQEKHREWDVSDARIYWELCQQEPLPPKALGDLLEAIAGALIIDVEWDLEAFSRVFLKLMLPFLERHRDPDALRTNPISMCLEGWNRLGVPRTEIVFEEASANSNGSTNSTGGEVVVVVKVRRQVVGTGRASGRMLAKQLAAANAAQLLSTNPLLVQEILKRS